MIDILLLSPTLERGEPIIHIVSLSRVGRGGGDNSEFRS